MSYIKLLKKKIIQADRTILSHNLNSLLCNVIVNYKKWVLNRLNNIISKSLKSNRTGNLNKELVKQLENFLKENWFLVRGNLLSSTAFQSELSLLLFDIAKDIMDFRKPTEAQASSLLTLLTPTLSLESLVPSKYPHLNFSSSEELVPFFKHVILSQNGLFCIPGSLVLTLNEDAPNDRLKNYYFDFEKHLPEHAFLNDVEMKSLVHHHPDAKEYFDAVIEYHHILATDNSLYANLEILWKHMFYNSKNIAGEEEIAGESFYTHLINFMHYYETLGDKKRRQIPQGVIAEIDLIKSVASVKSGFLSCLATRQEVLREVTRNNEVSLKKIRPSKKVQSEKLNEAKTRINEARTSFENALKTPEYHCIGNAGLNYRLVKTLNARIKLTPKSLFNFIKMLTPEEITSFCQNTQIRNKIVSSIQIENLVTLIDTGLSQPQYQSFIEGIGDQLINSGSNQAPIKTPQDLLALLIFLNNQKFDLMLKHLKGNLSKVVQSPYHLGYLLHHFDGSRFSALCEAFKPNLLELIKSPDDFLDILFFLNETLVFLAYKSWEIHFPEVIKTSKDFRDLLSFLDSSERKVIYNKFEERLPQFIQSPADIAYITEFMKPTLKLHFYLALKDHLISIIQSPQDIFSVIEFLNQAKDIKKYDALKERFLQIIQSAKDIHTAMPPLTATQKTIFYLYLGDYFPQFVKSAKDCSYILEFLNETQRTEIYEALKKDHLLELIKSAKDFYYVLKFLNETQRAEIYEILKKDHLLELIKSAKDFYYVLKFLNPIHRTEVFEALKNNLPSLINSCEDFSNAIEHLNCAQRITIYEKLKPFLISIVDNTNKLGQLLDFLDGKQCRDLAREVKGKHPKLLRSTHGFCNLIQPLTPAKRSVIFEEYYEYLPQIIRSRKELRKLLLLINDTQSLSICKILSAKCLKTIPSIDQFLILLTPISQAKRFAVFQGLSDHLANLIKSKEDLFKVLTLFDKKQCFLICQTLARYPLLANFSFKSLEELSAGLKLFEEADRLLVYELFNIQLRRIIYTTKDLVFLFQVLNQDQCASVCYSLQSRLPKIIKSSKNLDIILSFLNEDARKVFSQLNLAKNKNKTSQLSETTKETSNNSTTVLKESASNSFSFFNKKRDLSGIIPIEEKNNQIEEEINNKGQKEKNEEQALPFQM